MNTNLFTRLNQVTSFIRYITYGLLLLATLPATAQITWTARQQGFALQAITYANSRFVGVGYNNTVATSTDGTTWIKSLAGASDLMNGVAAGAAITGVVAVGQSGRIIGSTTDGLSWSVKASGTLNDLTDVAYGLGPNLYVAVGENGTILTSPDGSTWTARTSGTSAKLLGVDYGGGQFVAVGETGTILTSINGTSWTVRTSGTFANLEDVTYGAGKYVAVGGFSNNVTLTSSDGTTWTGQVPAASIDYALTGITFGNGQFVAVGKNGAVLTSPNGTSWTRRDLKLAATIQGVAYGAGKYVVAGQSIRVSSDGVTWQVTNAPDSDSNLYGVAYGNGRYVAVGVTNTFGSFGTTLVSTDGISFTRTDAGNFTSGSDVIFAQGLFVAVGNDISTSTDGITWTLRSPNATTGYLDAITYAGGRFVAVGSNGKAAVSTDGITWTPTNMGTVESFSDVTYGNSLYVAVGPVGTVRTSPDGLIWTARSSNATGFLSGVAYGNGVFVAVGYQGRSVRRSTDGLTWTGTDNSSGANYGHITFGNGLFVIINDDGIITTTPDGLNPVTRNSDTDNGLNDIAFLNGGFVAVGTEATVDTAPAVPMYTNLPPVAPVIPDQTATVGVGFMQNTPSFTDPNSSVQLITVQAFNLPLGLSYSGGASGIVAGNPTTAGVYSVSLVATDQPNEFITGGLSATAVYTITVNPPGGAQPFMVTGATLFSCDVQIPGGPNKPEVRAVHFAPIYAGTFTPPMTYSVVSLLLPTTKPDVYIFPAVDAPTVTIVATDAQGRTASYLWNWQSQCGLAPPVGAPFAIGGVTLNSCAPKQAATPNSPEQRTITFTPVYQGIFTSPVTFSVVSALLPTQAPAPYTLNVGTDAPILTLRATDAQGRTASYNWNWLTACGISPPVSNPAPPANSLAIGSVVLSTCTVVKPATANSPEVRQLTFTPQLIGTYTAPVTQAIPGALAPTSSLGPFTINVSTDAPTLTLTARDATNQVAPAYNWNWLQSCVNSTRLGAAEIGPLRVVVLGNPTHSDLVEVELSGVDGMSVNLSVVNMQGVPVSQQRVERAGATERQWVRIGRSAGIYLLKVQTATQVQAVRPETINT